MDLRLKQTYMTILTWPEQKLWKPPAFDSKPSKQEDHKIASPIMFCGRSLNIDCLPLMPAHSSVETLISKMDN